MSESQNPNQKTDISRYKERREFLKRAGISLTSVGLGLSGLSAVLASSQASKAQGESHQDYEMHFPAIEYIDNTNFGVDVSPQAIVLINNYLLRAESSVLINIDQKMKVNFNSDRGSAETKSALGEVRPEIEVKKHANPPTVNIPVGFWVETTPPPKTHEAGEKRDYVREVELGVSGHFMESVAFAAGVPWSKARAARALYETDLYFRKRDFNGEEKVPEVSDKVVNFIPLVYINNLPFFEKKV